MPYGVVTLLDEHHDHLVRQLWQQLETRFGLNDIASVPYPHFSYHVAARYALPKLEKTLTQISTQTAPFSVKTTGLGVFTGSKPVIYIPIVRSPVLTQLQHWVWHISDVFAIDTHVYYHPDAWMPHITVAQGDLSAEMLPEVVKFLNEQALNWQLPARNLAIIADGQVDSQPDTRLIFPFEK
jgi:hypothetical protein